MINPKQVYVLYDGRANFQETMECSVATVETTVKGYLKESTNGEWPDDYVWFMYDVNPKNPSELINERKLKTIGELK